MIEKLNLWHNLLINSSFWGPFWHITTLFKHFLLLLALYRIKANNIFWRFISPVLRRDLILIFQFILQYFRHHFYKWIKLINITHNLTYTCQHFCLVSYGLHCPDVCICVCLCAYISVCMFECIYVSVCVCMCVLHDTNPSHMALILLPLGYFGSPIYKLVLFPLWALVALELCLCYCIYLLFSIIAYSCNSKIFLFTLQVCGRVIFASQSISTGYLCTVEIIDAFVQDCGRAVPLFPL